MYNDWADALNAQLYERYAQTHSIYRETGKKLVEFAQIHPGMTVVDLACGTSIVTEQLLSALAQTGMVIAVDQSAAMLEIAAQKCSGEHIQFLCSPAEVIATVLLEASVDVVVCNAAFWQMKARETLEGLQKILKAGARFVFNFPLTRGLPIERCPPSAALPSFMRQVAQKEFGYNAPPRPKRAPLTAEAIQALLKGTSLTVLRYEDFPEEETAEEAEAFLRIPVMTQVSFPDLDYATRLDLLNKASQQYFALYSEVAKWTYNWRYYILQKR
jgi:ubiquinone/menaquinone biosynthesis C-methylase UbiE